MITTTYQQHRALRKTLVAFADAHNLRRDWHEPDDCEVTAVVRGNHLDNAMGDEFVLLGANKNNGEYVVIITGPHGRVSVNLATLLADYCALVRASTY